LELRNRVRAVGRGTGTALAKVSNPAKTAAARGLTVAEAINISGRQLGREKGQLTMSGSKSDEGKFIRYWYELVWALEGVEGPHAAKYYINPRKSRALFENALMRLERVMEKTLLAELRRKHRRAVAGRQWLALNGKLESLERSRNTLTSREKVWPVSRRPSRPSDGINTAAAGKLTIQKELAQLEEELGQEEVARLRRPNLIKPCGTFMLAASQWTAEKQREEDTRLLQDVEQLLSDNNECVQ
jgi:hypothetical protein